MFDGLEWLAQAEQKLLSEMARNTPLLRLDAVRPGGRVVFLKDESSNPVGSWRQRVARVLFLQALNQRQIEADKPVISNSPPAMAIAEAWYAQQLGLPYVAIVPDDCPMKESMQIEFCSGICHRVSAASLQEATEEVAAELTGVPFDNLALDAHLLFAAAEPMFRETEQQLAGFGQPYTALTFLTGASEQELYQALSALYSDSLCNRPICVIVTGKFYEPKSVDHQHAGNTVWETAPTDSQAGVEWLSDLTGRRFSLETGAAYVAIMERETLPHPEDSNACFVIVTECAGCHEPEQLLSRTKREWLRYRKSFQFKRRTREVTDKSTDLPPEKKDD